MTTPASPLRERLDGVFALAAHLDVTYRDLVAYGIIIDLEQDVIEWANEEEPMTVEDLIGNRADDMYDDWREYVGEHIDSLNDLHTRLNPTQGE